MKSREPGIPFAGQVEPSGRVRKWAPWVGTRRRSHALVELQFKHWHWGTLYSQPLRPLHSMHWVLCRVELVYAPRWCLGMSSSHPLFYPCHNCLFVFEMNINDKQYIILFGHFIIQILKNGLSYCQLNLLLIWQILYICTTHQTLLQTCSSFLKIHNRFLVNSISLYKLHIMVENKISVQLLEFLTSRQK